MIKKLFAPEHGFRGRSEAGDTIRDGIDKKTGIQVISLYGKNKKPPENQLANIDMVIFDLQDVGVRFYTYISTMTYVMEACSEAGMPMMILDRPNPNGFYIDGPVLETKFSSFVGLHPVPVVYGMTLAEYAQMVNGEGWLSDGAKCELIIIRNDNYTHTSEYNLPLKPSPNLPNMDAVYLYPSLCFFEGTIISIGRGTDNSFQVIGHPDFVIGSFAFKPKSIPGVAESPKYLGEECLGQFLGANGASLILKEKRLNLFWLIGMYDFFKDQKFFINYFDYLAGTDILRQQITEGVPESGIRSSWEPELNKFMEIRKKYLLYQEE